MSHCDRVDGAALYALGLLEDAESLPFEQHLKACPVCTDEVRKSGGLAVRLARTLPLSDPPAELRERVLAQAALPRGVRALVRSDRIRWKPTPFAGVSAARLYKDPVHGEIASLVRMAPGAHYPAHRHAGLEHCYVLEGDLVFEDHSLYAGDYEAGSPDNDHSSSTTTEGCLLFIVYNSHDQALAP